MESKIYIDLVRHMYAHPRLYGFFDSDEISDALSQFRPRIQSILERAEKESRTREAYLLSSMRFVAKSVHRQNFVCALCESAYLYSQFSEDAAVEAPAEPFPEEGERGEDSETPAAVILSPKAIVQKLSPERKRLLFLTLKCAWDVDEVLLKKCCGALGLQEQCLFWLVERAKRRTESNMAQITELNARLHELWIRLRVLELRLESSLLEAERAAILATLKRCRQRYFRLLERRKHRKPIISNECVSQLLEIPKGSVDSGLFYLKKNLRAAQTLAEYRKLG